MEKKQMTPLIAGSSRQLMEHDDTHFLVETPALQTLVKLSQRELDFIRRACSEKSYEAIAKEMFVSKRTVDGYREMLFRKLDVSTRVGLVMYAIRNKLVSL